MSKKQWSTILNSISDWLKLLGLIVLISEAVIIIAMVQTPKDSPLYIWYPIVMICFLIIIVIGLFWDRHNERMKPQKVFLGEDDRQLNINENLKLTSESLGKKDKYFIDSLLGFSIKKPSGNGWKNPNKVSLHEYAAKTGIINEGSSAEEFYDFIRMSGSLSELIINQEIILFEHGETIKFVFTDNSSTDSAEESVRQFIKKMEKDKIEINDQDIIDYRRTINETKNINNINFSNSLSVSVFNKELGHNSPIEPNISNFFRQIYLGSKEPLEQLIADHESITWITKNKLLSVKVNDVEQNVSIYRTYRVISDVDKVFLLQIQWTPISNSSVEIWEQMKDMFESFKIL